MKRELAPVLRPATEQDLAAILAIYNHYVINSTCTYQVEPDTLSDRYAWFLHHSGRHPAIVVESDGQVVGWGSLSPYHSRCAFRFTAENSVYIHPDYHRRGLGRLILNALLASAQEHGFHSVIAAISADQTASVKLHESLGFLKIGHFPEVGFKFDRWLDVVYYQHRLT